MKSMASELNMYQAQVAEHKYEIERLLKELAEVKRKYFEHKRREQAGAQAALRDSSVGGARAGGSRIAGGGFSLANPGAAAQEAGGAGAAASS
jgi:hypothetical protein